MKNDEIKKLLNGEDFHIDPLGRIVIDNEEILSAINGAMKDSGSLGEVLHNAGCANAGC